MKRITETTKTVFVNPETGEVLNVETSSTVKTITSKIKTDKFWFIYSSLITLLKGDNPTRTAISIFAIILGRYGSTEVGITKHIKQEIALNVDISLKSVERCIAELVDCKLLIHTGRSTYLVNPEYAYIGNSNSRKELILKLSEK